MSVELFLDEAVHITLLGTTPAEITVVVLFDEAEVHREKLEPTYTRVFPNGRDCDDGCLHANESVSVTAL